MYIIDQLLIVTRQTIKQNNIYYMVYFIKVKNIIPTLLHV